MARAPETALGAGLALGLASACSQRSTKEAAAVPTAPSGRPEARPDARQRALHLLSRFTFGPRPGDVQQVLALGEEEWLERQLDAKAEEDAALRDKLTPYQNALAPPRELAARLAGSTSGNLRGRLANAHKRSANRIKLRGFAGKLGCSTTVV